MSLTADDRCGAALVQVAVHADATGYVEAGNAAIAVRTGELGGRVVLPVPREKRFGVVKTTNWVVRGRRRTACRPCAETRFETLRVVGAVTWQ